MVVGTINKLSTLNIGKLIGTSKNGINVFKRTGKDVVILTSIKDNNIVKVVKQYTRNGNNARTVVKNLAKGESTNILHDFGTDNDYTETIFDERDDNLTPENVCRPRGSITLFRTRHPDTGKMNIMPFHTVTYPSLGTNQ